MRDRGLIIAVASSKGGAGKTTTAASLIGNYAAAGLRVAALDADPNRHLLRWMSAVGADCRPTDDAAIGEDVRASGDVADVVILDLPGVLGMSIAKAAMLADVVLIPTKTSDGDTAEAVRTYKAASDCRKPGGLTVALLVDVAQRRRLTGHSRAQLEADGVPVLTAALAAREAYPFASATGTMPTADKAAAADIAAVVAEIEKLLGSDHGR